DDVLHGGAGEDFLYGQSGNDFLDGGDGRDRIDFRDSTASVVVDFDAGTATGAAIGTDQLVNIERAIGSDLNDSLNGSAADESFTGGLGNDNIDGAGGNDNVWYGRSNAAVSVDLASGVVTGGEGNDQLVSIESVTGSNFADTLLGSDRNDRFSPDALGDQWTPNFNIGGADIIDGKDGIDTVSYGDTKAEDGFTPTGIVADLSQGTVIDPAGNTDQLSNIENIIGSSYEDSISGDSSANRLEGRGGNDVLYGLGGDDTLDGGDGDDILVGGGRNNPTDGVAIEFVQDWTDILIGGSGNDYIDASKGLDTAWGSLVRPGLGHDNVVGSQTNWANFDGLDLAYFDVSVGVTINVGDLGSGTVTSENGAINDTFSFAHFFIGTSKDDIFNGSDTSGDPFRIEGFLPGKASANGTDRVNGNGGHDRIDFGTAEFDGIEASFSTGKVVDKFPNIDADQRTNVIFTGIEEIRGSSGNDTITADGFSGNTWLDGKDGNDLLIGGIGKSYIQGGAGDDIIESGSGSDTLIGEEGADIYRYTKGDGSDIIIGYREDTGDNLLWLGYTDAEKSEITSEYIDGGWNDGQVIQTTPDGGRVHFYTYASTIIGTRDVNLISGTLEADHILGDNGDDIISSGEGNDILSGGAGNDTLDGGTGNDTLDGGAGDDTLDAGSGDDFVYGGDGNDVIIQSGSGRQHYDGGNGVDTYKIDIAAWADYDFGVAVNLSTGFSGIHSDPDHPKNDFLVNFENVDWSNIGWDAYLTGDEGSN
ncbi:hypothetical protein N9C16_11615, partial [Paracoccaceae bacterium]|nr:hypothetical protein [Paracoccaceae bacterium]